jgi:hypothetical protein
LQLTPKSQDALGAQIQSAIVNAPDEQTRQTLIDRATSINALKPPDAAEDFRRQQLLTNEVTKAYPAPDKASYGTEMAPAGLEPDAEAMVRKRADSLFNYSPDRTLKGNYSASAAEAIRQLQAEGKIETAQEVAAKRAHSTLRAITPGGTVGANPNTFTSTDLKGNQSTRLRVSSKGKLSDTVVSNPKSPQGPSLGLAPPGATEGQTVYRPNGQTGVVHNGQIYAQ